MEYMVVGLIKNGTQPRTARDADLSRAKAYAFAWAKEWMNLKLDFHIFVVNEHDPTDRYIEMFTPEGRLMLP